MSELLKVAKNGQWTLKKAWLKPGQENQAAMNDKGVHPLNRDWSAKPNSADLIAHNKRVLDQMRQIHDHPDTKPEHKDEHAKKIKDFILATSPEHLDKNHVRDIANGVIPWQDHSKIDRHVSPYKNLKELHDKQGPDAVKDFINNVAYDPYHYKSEKQKHKWGLDSERDTSHLFDELFEEHMNPNEDEKKKFDDLEKEYDSFDHDDDSYKNAVRRRDQYKRYKKHVSDVLWRNFRERHGLK